MNYQNLKISLLFILSILGLAGCDGSATDYVKSSRPSNTIDHPGPEISSGLSSFKVSPGKMKSSAAAAAVTGNVTATNKFLTSGNVSMSLAISRSRSSQ